MTHTLPPWARYFVVWVGLLALTLLSWLLSRAHLGGADIAVALVIATAKTLLVGLFFMHLSTERFSVVMIPCVAVFFIGLLLGLMVVDVATRQTFPRAPSPYADEPPALS